MSFSSRLRSIFLNCLEREKAPAASRCRSPRERCLPRLESLEDRTQPSTFTVKNLYDSGNYSLRAGILSGANTIDFENGLQGTITLTSGDLSVTHNVTIEGPGANKLTVSGDAASRVFDISGSANATIDGLTISGGLATAGGGILLEGNASLSIDNCTLTDNEALGSLTGSVTVPDGSGGGIEDNSSGSLTVANSTFNTNKAIARGPNAPLVPGYIIALGGAIDLSAFSTGTATINDNTFTGNKALGGVPGASGGGGAISDSSFTIGATANMTVTGCTLNDNAAIGEAGGGAEGSPNFGSGQGGGINNFANLIVSDSTLTNNLALGSPLAPGVAPAQSSNSGSSVAGGGIFELSNFTSDGTLLPATMLVEDSTLSCNQAVGGAGSAGNAANPPSAGSIGEGGGISVVVFSSAQVVGCTLADNVAQGGAGGGSGAVGGAGVSGGIDIAISSSLSVNNTNFIGNLAIGGAGGFGTAGGDGIGGGINVGTGDITGYPDNCSLTLTSSNFIGNLAVGGAAGSGGNGGNGQGGGLSVLTGCSASIDPSLIFANFALGGSHGQGGVSGQGIGGGLYIQTDAGVTLGNPGEVFLNFASTSNDDIFGIYIG
ncbi:MAG TPA: hypothetical protein VG097_17685 [Gemmata sp.]|nr:hypothetical protein [Gemmata sp.]